MEHEKLETLEQASPDTETVVEAKPEYDLHIKVPADMRQTLKDAATLAFKMGDIPKPDLVNLMNLYIEWGMAVQKKKWLDRVGYK